jgi:WD40-like Beta Propeller Repeat
MRALTASRKRRLGVGAAALVVVGAAGITFVVAETPPRGGCVSDEPLFAYTRAARKLRQTEVGAFHEGNVVRVTTDQLSQDPSFSPDGSRVVFSSGRDGEFDPEVGYSRLALFTANSTGGDEERLTSGVYDYEPDWSPDGSKVVFVRRRYSASQNPQEEFPQREELWTVDVDSKEEQLLLRAPPSARGKPFALHSPMWSPDGSQIVFSRAGEGGHGLWLMGADGADVRRIVTQTGTSYFDSPGVAWSPNGEQLALHGGTEHGSGIIVMDIADPRRRLFATGVWPAWSPDGKRIAYFEFQPPDNGYRLTLRDADGTDKEYLDEATAPISGAELDWACARPGGGPTALPPPDEPGARCDGTFHVVHRSIRPGGLQGIDFTPAGGGWAVAEDPSRVVRFNKQSFEYALGLPVSGEAVALNDVAAAAPDDVFVAGGELSRHTRRWGALVLRWDGDEWVRMDVPAVPDAILQGLEAIAPDDVWAVGFSHVESRSRRLVLHFDGTRWSRVGVPSSRRNEGLVAVGASSATNVWAVGNRGEDRALVLRYDGSRWAEVDLPRLITNAPARLNAIEVLSPDNVWIVGNVHRAGHGYLSVGVLQFDGRRWRTHPIGESGTLADVEAVGRHEVWAVGYTGSAGLEATAKPLAVRHTDSWQRVAVQDPAVGGEFAGMAVDNGGNVWAIGEKAGSDWVIQRACRSPEGD